MAICEFAVKKLIPPGSNDPRIKPRVGIWHVDAGNASSLYDYFAHRSGGIESHFFIDKSGELEQYRDTDWEADANYRANPFGISVETQGFGEGLWTPDQIDTSKRLMLWLHKKHGIPLRKVEKWDGSGFGYHTQFGAPGPWTPVAKSCPGPQRIQQFNNVLVPWLRSGASMGSGPTPNLTAALQADTYEKRMAALRLAAERGTDEVSAAAKHWMKTLRELEKAKKASRNARIDVKDLEVR